jgi:hypothetical protein
VIAAVIHVASVWMSLDLGTTFWTQAIPNSVGVAIGLAGVLRGESNRLAWLVLIAFFGITVSELLVVSEWLVAQGSVGAAAWWVVIVGTTNDGFGLLMLPALGPVMLLGLMYPTAHFTSRRWRAYAVVTVVVLLAGGVASFMTEPAVGDQVLRHPVLGDQAGREILDLQYMLFFLASILFLFSLTSLVGRFRTSDTVIRQQIKLLGFGLAIYGIFNLVTIFLTEDGPGVGAAISVQTSILLDSIVFSIVPISLGFAMFRYRLFDVDRVISRTVGYALVLGAVGAVFAVIVAIPAVLLSRGDVEAWEVALATLGAAALFDPIRVRIQRAVDRRFDRSRFDAATTIERLGVRMQETVDSAEVSALTATAVDRMLRPSSIGFWVSEQ